MLNNRKLEQMPHCILIGRKTNFPGELEKENY